MAFKEKLSEEKKPNQMLKLLIDIVLVFVFTTTLTNLYITRIQRINTLKETLNLKKESLIETLRLEKLQKLQKTIFVNLTRPPDRTYNINVTLSEHTPLERNITDTRPRRCPRHYDISNLPTVSVVIPFYNEALSMLLRTVHSVLMRTPAKLLREVIIVDDHSPNEDLHGPLEQYIRLLPRKVHLIRMNKREGLIRARLTGANMATGDVLMFQDAHTECNVGWAEPLLFEISKNPRTVIQPHVDQIEQFTMAYIGNAGPVPRGGFSWDLRYVWMEMPHHEARRVNYQHEFVAHRTPTMVGCAIAIRKDYFFSIGGFDDDMQIWGGENIELGFRAWMCGGQVLNHPCSRVAHTFKPFAYSFDGHREKIVQKNQMRMAEVWMDDWKKFFLASTNSWPTKHVSFTPEEKASLEKRKIMRNNLKCKSFKWYMENIISEVPTPPMNAVYYGELFNLQSELCFYITSKGYVGLTSFCFFHRLLPKNLFYIDIDNRLIYRHRCVFIDYETKLLKLGTCRNSGIYPIEKWDVVRHSEVEGMLFVDVQQNPNQTTERLCTTQVTNVAPIHYREQMPQVLPCNGSDRFQKWRWTYKFNFTYDWEHYTTSIEE